MYFVISVFWHCENLDFLVSIFYKVEKFKLNLNLKFKGGGYSEISEIEVLFFKTSKQINNTN